MAIFFRDLWTQTAPACNLQFIPIAITTYTLIATTLVPDFPQRYIKKYDSMRVSMVKITKSHVCRMLIVF